MLTEILTDNAFDLQETLNSGQVFHWEECEMEGVTGFAGCIADEANWIAQPDKNRLLLLSDREESIQRYLGLDHDWKTIRSTFPPGDEFLNEAIAFSPGIRLIHQPLWECLATFITSSLKQVAHIRAISLTLRREFGEPRQLPGSPSKFFTYPSPETLAAVGEDQLRQCALGYRAKSLQLAARAIADGDLDLDRVANESDTAKARDMLTQLHGVGEKIANCVLLFGCGRWETFPIDVWIERVLRRAYRKRIKGEKLQKWAENHFGPNAGYAQQYLFHFARKTF